jgi:protocatechuate 3,4-dioxygenase beta subunit
MCTASVVALGGICLIAQTPPARPPDPALVTGRVVEAESGTPIPAAIVTAVPTGQNPAAGSSVLTDEAGRFFFDNLGAGRYDLTATKPGWIAGAFGRHRPLEDLAPLEVRAGDRRADLGISMWTYAVVSGRVVDEEGDPLVKVDVRIFRSGFAAGRRHWSFSTRALTDDRGAFRFSNLVPGDYLVVVPATVRSEPDTLRLQNEFPHAYLQTMTSMGTSPMSFDNADMPTSAGGPLVSSILSLPRPPAASGAWTTYATTFFASSTRVDQATVVRAVSGRERENVNLVVRPTQTYQVAGTLELPDGQPAPFHAVHLVAADSADEPLVDAGTAITDTDGRFTFFGIPSGSYVARVVRTPWPEGQGARMSICGGTNAIHFICSGFGTGPGPPPMPSEPLLAVDQPITVADDNVRGVTMTLRPGARVSGRAEFDGTSARPTDAAWRNIAVLLEAADGQSPQPAGGFPISMPGRFSTEGQFATPSTRPGRYLLRISSVPAGWTFKSAMSRGRDVSETPFDLSADLDDVIVTFTDRPAKVSGVVSAPNGQPDADALVLFFPTDPAAWRDYGRTSLRARAVGTDSGRFTIAAPPAGEYYIVAIPDSQADDWQDPVFLARLAPSADRIRIDEGQVVTHALQTRPLR